MPTLKYDLYDIVKVSTKLSGTGEVRVWSKDENPPHPSGAGDWQYAVHSWDPVKKEVFGMSFYLKEGEIIKKIGSSKAKNKELEGQQEGVAEEGWSYVRSAGWGEGPGADQV